MARKFATGTTIPTEKSRDQIVKELQRYGATAFGYFQEDRVAQIQFKLKTFQIRFTLRLPDKDAKEFALTPAGRKRRSTEDRYLAWDMECRRRWRALHMAVKAKLVCVTDGIATFEEEFLAYIVDPLTGRTVSEVMLPQITESYQTHQPKQLLLKAPEE